MLEIHHSGQEPSIYEWRTWMISCGCCQYYTYSSSTGENVINDCMVGWLQSAEQVTIPEEEGQGPVKYRSHHCGWDPYMAWLFTSVLPVTGLLATSVCFSPFFFFFFFCLLAWLFSSSCFVKLPPQSFRWLWTAYIQVFCLCIGKEKIVGIALKGWPPCGAEAVFWLGLQLCWWIDCSISYTLAAVPVVLMSWPHRLLSVC